MKRKKKSVYVYLSKASSNQSFDKYPKKKRGKKMYLFIIRIKIKKKKTSSKFMAITPDDFSWILFKLNMEKWFLERKRLEIINGVVFSNMM